MMASSSEKERLQAEIKAQGEVVRKLKQEKRPQEEVGDFLSIDKKNNYNLFVFV